MNTPAQGLPSIRQRLVRVLAGVSLAWAVAVSAVVWFTVHHALDEVLDNALRESAEVMYGVLSGQAGVLSLGHAASLPAPPHAEHLVWQIVDARGSVLLRSHQAPDAGFGPPQRVGLWSAAGDWRVCGLALPAGGDTPARTLFVAQRLDERHGALWGASALTACAALAVGLLCAAWLRRLAREELQPLVALSRAVEGFDPQQGGQNLAQVTRAELVPMRAAILSLAQRLALHVANERAVAAHAAHALRTPLAGLVVQLATAQRQAPPAIQPALQLARLSADRLTRVVGALLTLFRSGAELQWQPVDLAALLANLPVDGLQLRLQPAGPLPLRGDPDLLAAALANLLDNAARHGARTLHVQVLASGDGQRIVLADDGPGVAPQRLAELQTALAAQDYASALGLGLMLADLVARAHGGQLRLPPAARGFTAEMWLGPAPQG